MRWRRVARRSAPIATPEGAAADAAGAERLLRQLGSDTALRLLDLAIQMRNELDTALRDQDDPDVLDRLYALDSLACRVRRTAENLHVLAAWQPPFEDGDNQVTVLADLIDAALGRIAGWPRVTVGLVDTIAVTPAASGDLIRIMTELLDNAVRYSPVAAPITVTGHLLHGGSAQIRVENAGYGIPAGDLNRYNDLLRAGISVLSAGAQGSVQQGLQVVCRAAAQVGVVVSLVDRQPRGTIAVIDIPAGLLTEIPTAPATTLPVGRRPKPRPNAEPPATVRAVIPVAPQSSTAMPVRVPESVRPSESQAALSQRPDANLRAGHGLADAITELARFGDAFGEETV